MHVDKDLLPDDLVRVEFEIPESLSISTLSGSELPDNWRSIPAPASLQLIGTRWAMERTTAVFRVPSAVIPQEYNYLINADHPDSQKIKTIDKSVHEFDPRFLP